MFTTTHHTNSTHYPQTAQPFNGELSNNHRRPSHVPSKNLTQKETECLYNILGNNCVTLATAVVQLLHSYDNQWTKYACGVLCFIKDYNARSYFFRLYDLRSKQSIFEEMINSSTRLQKRTDRFYSFDGMNFKIGFNFTDSNEAETFCNLFHTKQDHRLNKKKFIQSGTESIGNHVKTLSNDIKQVFISAPNLFEFPKKKPRSKAKKSSNNKFHHPTISSPTSFVHFIHVGPDESYVTDETHTKLFEEVLSNMPLSKEEKSYIKNAVANTKEGLGKLFTTPNNYYDTVQYGSSDNRTESRPSNDSPIRPNNTKRVPYQDISMPSPMSPKTASSQISKTSTVSGLPIPPKIPPRPSTETRQRLLSPVETSCPMPTIQESRTKNSNIPSAPPLPQSTRNDVPAAATNNSHDALFQQIRDNYETRKNGQQEPKIMKPLPKNEPKVEIQRTLEMNIMDMILQRRSKIMGHGHNSDDDSDDSDDSDDQDFD